MQEGILDLQFRVGLSIPLVLVLEPSEDTWDRVYSIGDGLVQSLPGRIEQLYFLGNVQNYSVAIPRDFRDRIPGWFSENKGRVTLIGPILEKLEREGYSGMVVIICTMPPVDVGDWLDTAVIDRTIFVRVGEKHFDADLKQVDSSLPLERIIEAFDSPAYEISVEGLGFCPLWYKTEPEMAVHIIYEQGGFSLKIPSPDRRLDLHLKALCPRGAPSLSIKRRNGWNEVIRGEREHPRFNAPEWEEIPESVRPVIAAGITRTSYLCTYCGAQHDSETFLCPQGDMILRGMPLNTCLLLTKKKYFPLTSWYAYPLNRGSMIITRKGELYRLNDGQWNPLHRVNPFEEIDDGLWGLFHHI